MPFTPFHFGPAALLKAAAPRHFSFTVFCFAQCVIDAEVLVRMAAGITPLHGFLHSWIGAAAAGCVAIVAGKPVCQKALSVWHASPDVPLKEYFNPAPAIGWIPAATGAFAGTFSHVLLDSMMHSDLKPGWPARDANPLLGIMGEGTLHALCFALGIAGIWLCARYRKDCL